MKLLLLFLVIVSVHAETAADLAQRAMDLGQTFLTKNELTKCAQCMETPVYDQSSPDQLKVKGMGCAGKNIIQTKFLTGMNLLNSFNQCIKPKTWEALAQEVYDKAYPIFGPELLKCNGSLTEWKRAGIAKAKCIADGYKMILTNVAKAPYLDKMCMDIVQSGAINLNDWTCVKKFAPNVLNIAKYACSKVNPKS